MTLESADVLVGKNVRRLRELAGLSQTELAHALTERGTSFHQQTVVKVEKGERPLKFTEAAEIGIVLNADLYALLTPSFAAERLDELRNRTGAFVVCYADVYTAASRLISKGGMLLDAVRRTSEWLADPELKLEAAYRDSLTDFLEFAKNLTKVRPSDAVDNTQPWVYERWAELSGAPISRFANETEVGEQ